MRADCAATVQVRINERSQNCWAFEGRIERLYVYHWRADAFDNRFDAGLLGKDGVPRASYYTLKRWLSTPWFTP